MSIEIKRSDKYVDYNISATNNRGYITIDTSDWINKPWMFYELPSLKFEIYTETNGELVKYQNFTREIRTYNPVYSPLGILNVTIDIRNVPEEFILRITPIFDNDAVTARNMLIENGIENGEIWGSDQDVPTQLFNLNLEFIECEGEYIPPTPPVPPTHEETITGVPPITFDGSTGEPLVSWTILGNGSQSGTPTPDNPVMPEFVGVRTGNLANMYGIDATGLSLTYKTETNMALVINGTKTNGANVRDLVHPNITLPAGTYTVKIKMIDGSITGIIDGVFFGINRNTYALRTIPGVKSVGDVGTRTFTLSDDTKITSFDITPSYGSAGAVFNNATFECWFYAGSDALPYEPYGYKIPITNAGQTTPVYLGRVSTVRRVRKLVLTGEEDWRKSSSYNAYFLTTIADYAHIQSNITVCTHYPSMTNVSSISGVNDGFVCWTYDTSTDRLYFRNDSITSLADFKTFLATQYAAGNPVTVWYVLATPETGIINEPLAKIGTYADELHSEDAGVSIPTDKGNNVLTVDTDLQPSEVTITYIKEGQ